MPPPLTPLADRSAEYAAELHDVSNIHRVPYGKPVNLFDLVDALRASEAFASDFGFAIRSIVLREHFQSSEEELLTLVAVAWSGLEPNALTGPESHAIAELRKLLRTVLARPTSGPIIPETEDGVDDPGALDGPIVSSEPERVVANLPHRFERNGDGNDRIERPPLDDTAATHEVLSRPKPRPSVAEVVALGLAGLVTALLFSVASLPVYRTRISVYLPSADAAVTPGLQDGALVNGEVTGLVAQRLLSEPHPRPILREDVLSRGMRELHMGGHEPILYADLVSETARQVRIRHLQPANVFEVTCDSWSAELATTFCNELGNSMVASGAVGDQAAGEFAHTIDAASNPGNQVYPHWYLQGFVGLAFGCAIGLALGFTKWPARDASSGDDA